MGEIETTAEVVPKRAKTTASKMHFAIFHNPVHTGL
jgi:hypothetical protein